MEYKEENMTIVFAIIMICILIFIHELGHFIAAKACGVKVNEFALGMGPAIIKRQRGETLYSLRIIPIGGYCAMEGEDEDSEDEKAFNKKPAWQKAIILVAGAGMNLIMAIVLMIIVTYYIGFPTSTIGNVQEDSPAQAAGIVAGDVILEADGTVVDDWYDFTDIVEKHDNGEPLQLVVERDGSEVEVYATPEKGEDGRYIIGVGTQMERSAFKSIVKGPEATWDMTKNMYTVIKQLITGEVSTKDLAGPVGIVYMVDQSVSQGFELPAEFLPDDPVYHVNIFGGGFQIQIFVNRPAHFFGKVRPILGCQFIERPNCIFRQMERLALCFNGRFLQINPPFK